MGFISSKTMRLVSFGVFLLGLVSAGIAYSSRPSLPVDVFIVSERTFIPAGGAPVNQGTDERLQKSDGSYVDIKKFKTPEGQIQTQTLFSEIGRGAFRVDEKTKTLHFLSDASPATQQLTEEVYRRQPAFVGEDTLLGYRVLVTKDIHGEGNYTELYRAPDLQWQILKRVHGNEAGTTVIEAKEVKTGAAARVARVHSAGLSAPLRSVRGENQKYREGCTGDGRRHATTVRGEAKTTAVITPPASRR
jgi:hypothetical protein